jgi:hypothetical protein
VTPFEAVMQALARWPLPRVEGNAVVVPTHCLYLTNHIVQVHVEGGEGTFVVHDNGGAIDQLRAMGGHDDHPLALMKSVARRDGLKVSDLHRIYTSGVSVDGLEGAISLVANASRDAADVLVARYRPTPRRPLGEELEMILNLRFPALWRKEEVIVGQSNKQYRFDYSVVLPQNRKLILDTVMPDASSINAAVVANLDVRNAHPTLVQRIVYDDEDKWPVESLRVLRVGAPPIALSGVNDALQRLAA